jgi:hypothetical protein
MAVMAKKPAKSSKRSKRAAVKDLSAKEAGVKGGALLNVAARLSPNPPPIAPVFSPEPPPI